MIKWLKAMVLTLALAFVFTPRLALAADPTTGVAGDANVTGGLGVNDFTDAASESSGLTTTLRSVTKYAMYIFYLLGVIFMGVAAIKFKNGDMEAMGKNFGGAVVLFLVPKIVEVILAWAAQ